jgi:DNA-binding transcriptional LysR family regulator
MVARAQSRRAAPRARPAAAPLGALELRVLLALSRGRTLGEAAARLEVDASTVFRVVQRTERALGQRVFDRSRDGYRPTDLGLRLVGHAERVEAELEAARSAAALGVGAVSGTVRVSTTDTLLHALVLPTLAPLLAAHPDLVLQMRATNERVDLTQREADIALRATSKPPPHLIGRELGPIRVAVYAPRALAPRLRRSARDLAALPWLAVDEALPEHPSVRWRKRHLPSVVPRVVADSVLSVVEGIAGGAGVGIVPLFAAAGRSDLVALTPPLDDAETTLWLLTHPESRHLRRIAGVAAHLAGAIRLA